MGQVALAKNRGVTTAELRQELEQALTKHRGRSCRIVRLRRQLSDYRSSFALEDLDVGLEDGTTLQLVFKDLGRQGLLDEARLAKPIFLYNPLREIETYRILLAPECLGTAICYGAVVNAEVGRYWLFLERVLGERLRYVGEMSIWEQAARQLATIHKCFTGRPDLLERSQQAQAIRYDQEYYWLWWDRALKFVRAGRGDVPPCAVRRLERLGSRYRRVIARLLALPVTLIHGEFYPANVLVCGPESAPRICPVDWETTAIGPGLIDLAALRAGGWTEDQKTALAMSYFCAVPSEDRPWHRDEFLTALDYCELHLAVQWLGWSPNWSPPPEEARSWLDDVLCLAEKLGLG